MFRFHHAAAAAQDLIILGGGASAVTALIALLNEIKRQPPGTTQPLAITILERSNSAGNGMPYDPQLQHPVLRVNNPNAGMIIDTENPLDFVHWLQTHGDRLKQTFPAITQIIDDNISGKDSYAPRILFGKYLQERMTELIAEANQFGIRIDVQTNIDVTDAIQDAEARWFLKTENHGTYSAKNLLIAAGHLPSEKFTALKSAPGYFNTPYTDLSVTQNAPVFILGSGLSAIDAVKLLAHHQIHAPIYLISPSGQLPRVKGPLGTTHYQMKFLTPENLSKPNLRLAEVMHLFTEEVKNATGNNAWTLAAVMRMARQENSDPVRTLQREIDWVEHNRMRGWQLMLARIWFSPLPLVWEYLDDRDRPEFINQIFPLFLKWGAGTTLGNAKEMAALAAKGQLHLIKTRSAVTYHADTRQFQITTDAGKTLSAAAVINAAGHGTDINNNPTLRAMVKRGLIRQEQFRGGIDLDDHAHLIDASGKPHDNGFALGMITLGRNLDASSIEMAAHAAKKMAPQLMQKLYGTSLSLMNPVTATHYC